MGLTEEAQEKGEGGGSSEVTAQNLSLCSSRGSTARLGEERGREASKEEEFGGQGEQFSNAVSSRLHKALGSGDPSGGRLGVSGPLGGSREPGACEVTEAVAPDLTGPHRDLTHLGQAVGSGGLEEQGLGMDSVQALFKVCVLC